MTHILSIMMSEMGKCSTPEKEGPEKSMAREGCEKLENIVTCSLCYEIFTSPKTFTCFHSYCEACIHQLKHDTTQQVHGYKCPLCRRFCAVEDIKPNFLMNELVELYRLTLDGGAVRSCTQCKATDPQWRCLDCKIDFCATCKEGHTRVPLLRGHRLIANEDINDDFLVDKLIFCQIHNDKPIEFNCKVCDHLLCITCKIVDHDCHKTETISTALDRIVPKIHSDIGLVTSCIDEAQERIEALKKEKDASIKSFGEVKETMEKHKDDLIRKILEDHNDFVTKLDAEKNKQAEDYEGKISSIEDRIKEKRHIITWANTSIQAAQGASLLYEIQNGLGSKLNNMASEVSPEPLPQSNEVEVKFEKSLITPDSKNALGDLVITRNEPKRELIPMEPNSSRVLQFSFSGLAQGKTEMVRQIQILEGHLCYRFAIINSHLWLPIYNKNCILIYSLEGEMVRSIRFQKQIKRPKAVISQDESHAVVCSHSGLFVIQQEDGEIIQQVSMGQFSDAFIREQTLAALEWKNGKIHIFTLNCQIWDLIRTVDVAYNDRHIGDTLLCINDVTSDDDVYVTCSWQKHTVYQYSAAGEIEHQFGGPGDSEPGQLYCPSLSAIDKEGATLVADCGNHRLQIKQDQDNWQVLKMEGLQCPWDVHFQGNDTMWVLNNEKCLLQYKLK